MPKSKRHRMIYRTISSLSAASSPSVHSSVEYNPHELDIEKLAEEMTMRAKESKPFSEKEMDEIMVSFLNVLVQDDPNNQELNDEDESSVASFDLEHLRKLIQTVGHLPHKEWDQTGESARKLREILLQDSQTLTDEFKRMFQRVITEGNWDAAAQHAKSIKKGKPWAVLVTGVNGIRKTTSVYQPWFKQLLSQALVYPISGPASNHHNVVIDVDELPTGENSFFRQLDHMIITLINHNFEKLYAMTELAHDFEDENGTEEEPHDSRRSNPPPSQVIQKYSNYKAALFTRYRTLSEILGVLLVREAQSAGLNIMVETSGRDVAMFHYIDSFFPVDQYNKLALHFTINDLSHAEQSVDNRMVGEMKSGIQALKSKNVQNIIKANVGGPYGSEVLKGIQEDSDKVWNSIISNVGEDKNVGNDWFKASIHIKANLNGPWMAHAILPDGSIGTEFTFEPPREV